MMNPDGTPFTAHTTNYHVPTFVFVNKMDLPGKSREELLAQLNHRLGEGFVAFDVPQADRDEALALCDESRWIGCWMPGS